jgi:malonyl-CoA/methylmalonyl-CoA synthetase
VLAALLYTLGITGRSKGVMLSHDNLLSNARALTDFGRSHQTTLCFMPYPFSTRTGFFLAINSALLAGARVRFMAGFDIDEIIEALAVSTLMMGVPTFYTRLLSDDRLTRERVADMRFFVSGSAPLFAETHEAFTARTGNRILERYGMTETNMITSNPYDGARRAGTVGFALAGTEVRLTKGETGELVTAGEIGMIEVRGRMFSEATGGCPAKQRKNCARTGFHH